MINIRFDSFDCENILENLEKYKDCRLIYDNEACGSCSDLRALAQLQEYGYFVDRLIDNGHGGYAVILKNTIKR